jgi:hypothetical protein
MPAHLAHLLRKAVDIKVVASLMAVVADTGN